MACCSNARAACMERRTSISCLAARIHTSTTVQCKSTRILSDLSLQLRHYSHGSHSLHKKKSQNFPGWLGSRVVSVLDLSAVGPGFKSQPRRCRLSLRQTVHTHHASVHQAAKLVPALLRVSGENQAWRKVMAAYRWVYDSRHLQADCQEPGSAAEPYT